jgi:hypothetical protein
VQVDRELFIAGSSHAEQFGRALQELTLNVYGQLAINLQEVIERKQKEMGDRRGIELNLFIIKNCQKLVTPAFLHEDQAVMEVQRTPQRGTSQTHLHANGVHSPSSSHSSTPHIPSLTQLTTALSNVLTILHEARCPAAVVRQFFQ